MSLKMYFPLAIFVIFLQVLLKPSSAVNSAKVDKLRDEVLARVLTPSDGSMKTEIKSKLVDYLVETTVSDYQRRKMWVRQDDGDEGAAGGDENQDVYNGVRRILQNVFSGNLIGVIQESVSIRSPGPVSMFFADVMGALFGSAAVKGAGTIGLPVAQNETETANATVPQQAGTGVQAGTGQASLANRFQQTNLGSGSGAAVTNTASNSNSNRDVDDDERDEVY